MKKQLQQTPLKMNLGEEDDVTEDQREIIENGTQDAINNGAPAGIILFINPEKHQNYHQITIRVLKRFIKLYLSLFKQRTEKSKNKLLVYIDQMFCNI